MLEGVTTTLPAQLVSGARIKATASVRLVNRLGGAIGGVVTARLFASADAVFDASDVELAVLSKKLKLAQGRSASLRVKLSNAPAVPEGTFQVFARIERPDGGTEVVAAPAGFTAAAPFVDLRLAPAGGLTKVMKPGAKSRAKLGVQNLGNVRSGDAAGAPASVTLYADPGSAAGAEAGRATLVTAPLKLRLNPQQSGGVSLSFTVPASLAAGTYQLVAVLSGADGDTGVNVGTIVVA